MRRRRRAKAIGVGAHVFLLKHLLIGFAIDLARHGTLCECGTVATALWRGGGAGCCATATPHGGDCACHQPREVSSAPATDLREEQIATASSSPRCLTLSLPSIRHIPRTLHTTPSIQHPPDHHHPQPPSRHARVISIIPSYRFPRTSNLVAHSKKGSENHWIAAGLLGLFWWR